jgi:tRNA threonylcarbamoyladenosine biosynthesis protein TsaB
LPLILYIETSGEVCSVCLAKGEKVLGIKESIVYNSHASAVAVFVQELFTENNIVASNLNAVCVSAGPGSYTGLRIGVSLAKGICFANNLPLIAVSTLAAMANGAIASIKDANLWYCPMIDARRMEVYTAIYNNHLNIQQQEQPLILTDIPFEIDYDKIIFFGSGASKVLQINAEAKILKHFVVSATQLIALGIQYFEEKKFEDLAYFEPNYIKPFYSLALKK